MNAAFNLWHRGNFDQSKVAIVKRGNRDFENWC